MADQEIKASSEDKTSHHVEGDLENMKANQVFLKSTADSLGLWETALAFPKAVIVCNLLCIAAAADGYQINLNGNIIANQGFTNHLGFLNDQGKMTLNAQHTALWGAMQSLGQLVGMIGLNPISDRIGRKVTLYVLWVILVGSLIMETLVRDWKDWAGAKLLAGIGIGAIQATLPVYVMEWAPVNIRVLFIVQRNDPNNFKTPIVTQWGFLGIMLPIFLLIPETPAYYAEKGLDEQGKRTLKRINGKVRGYDVEAEYAIIKNTILVEQRARQEYGQDNMGFKDLLRSYGECFNRRNVRRTLGACLPGCAQQLAGLSFLNTYASLFFKQSGFDNAFLITTVLCSIQLATSIALMLLSDKFGRRQMVFGATIICTLTLLMVGILGFVTPTQALKSFLVFLACAWSFANTTIGSLGYAFVGEVACQKLRARTAGVASGLSVIFGLTFNTSLPIILDVNGPNWGYKTAWLFFGTGVCVCILLYCFLPEGSRRNAAEMDELYEKGVPAWKMHKYVTEIQSTAEARDGVGPVL